MLQIYDTIEYLYIQGYVASDWCWWDIPLDKPVAVDAD